MIRQAISNISHARKIVALIQPELRTLRINNLSIWMFYPPEKELYLEEFETSRLGDSNEVIASYESQQVNVIAFIVAAGVGRWRILSTSSNGTLNAEKTLNLFRTSVINLGDVYPNDLYVSSKQAICMQKINT